ncbi:AMP-binding protein [Aquincola sp. S2]|uniref:AMP-binding protein n=1 Tax=Pseudaquabacterium terrae TaxID=2732868 RepID=A0ABX2EDN6_9BURK|nr:AMP-binding protein [Aquabacterium terrae]NRF66482.1 AMP-binding protein [Aquabacterium terrae]
MNGAAPATSPQTTATTIPALLAQRIATTPQAEAFRIETAPQTWAAISWAEFGARCARLAAALAAAGLRRGDRLALIAPNSLEWELLQHATLRLGAIIVGLDAHDVPERIAALCEQADIVAFATTQPRLLSQVDPRRLQAARLLLVFGEPSRGAANARQISWTQLMALAGEDSVLPAPPASDELATVIFTSGTTGAAKGIAYTHRQLCLAVDAICDVFDFVGPQSRLLCWLPLSNLFQRMVDLSAVRQGATTWILDDPRRVMEVVAQVSPDIFVGVPRFYEKLHEGLREGIASRPALQRRIAETALAIGRRAAALRREGRPLPAGLKVAHFIADRIVLSRLRRLMGQRLRCMVTGSAPLARALLEEFDAIGWEVLEAYGLSENVVPMAISRPGDARAGSVGKPLPGNHIVVGDGGAIKVRGPGVFKGYLGEPPAPVDADGYYTTGDLGSLDAEGYLRLTGRSSELIKTSTGRRIAPLAIEAQLRTPGVDHVLVLGSGRKCLVALCTIAPGKPFGAEERARLTAALREKAAAIGTHERPGGIALLEQAFTIEAGELTTNLKLRRAAIETRHAALIERLYETIDRQAATGARELVVL